MQNFAAVRCAVSEEIANRRSGDSNYYIDLFCKIKFLILPISFVANF